MKTRRECLKMLAAGAGVTAAAASSLGSAAAGMTQEQPSAAKFAAVPPEHERRIAWWREARFGMFIHWGLYSQLGRGEWAMSIEDIPVPEYERLATTFHPKPNAAREWARLAKHAGMKYMVMTAKHHEGYCLWDSKLTDYCATRTGPQRDLVREYVDAARAEGLRVGFYYSLMDWHHPDGMKSENDPEARRRFVNYTHGLIRELLTNYGKIDILWYDMAVPLDARQWESEKMNQMVFELQPDILVNNRNRLRGDFSTPEQTTEAGEAVQHDWESCMTLNENWGYCAADDNWKPPQIVLRNLVHCAQNGGNYLLNIGPKADGSIPEPSTRILTEVGNWMQRNGETIYGSEKSPVTFSNVAGFTWKKNTLYTHVHFWPGSTVTLGGVRERPTSARLVKTGATVKFEQAGSQLKFTGLPDAAPDNPVTVIAAEFNNRPEQDSLGQQVIRINAELEWGKRKIL